ncbi:MAG: isocitrate/isopropylmalate family dehydrogenase [Eubacteriaceae bacterium]|nr:isocitrate/isopropylmalate family dehydrogenase [Eubacteriaceae bacterium]
MFEKEIKESLEKFEKLIASQLERIERMKKEDEKKAAGEAIVIGICGGDGIGPIITKATSNVLASLLASEIEQGKVVLREIEGLTIENRIEKMQAIPDDVLAELKECDTILKGPTTTPQAGDGMPNIESANVKMRKELDLYANVRPVRIPEQGIDWTFFRENTEGAYALGSEGMNITEDLAFDFTVTTTQGTDRIARAAYEFAHNNKKDRVSIITKANVVKTTDGKFLELSKQIAKEYPDIITDEWYVDILSAKLIDEKRRRDFKVLVLPNLYGDIITDEAAEFQGGVGTAGSANIGDKHSMFEAIHGSAPRMIQEGRGHYADPVSILRAAAMLLSHIGYFELSQKLDNALDECAAEKKVVVTGRDTGATCEEFIAYLETKL